MSRSEFSAVQGNAEMRNWVLLDSQSTVDLFCNPKLVTDIREEDDQLILATNAGNLITNQKATVPGYGKVWFKEEAMTNVFSLANMEKRHHITYDSAKESAFIVHTDKGPLRFEKGPENLYYFTLKHLTINVEAQVVQTVEENKSFYTDRQVEIAKKA